MFLTATIVWLEQKGIPEWNVLKQHKTMIHWERKQRKGMSTGIGVQKDQKNEVDGWTHGIQQDGWWEL